MTEEKPNSCAAIRERIDLKLAPLAGHKSCALLDYPYYFNVGDHLIWLGAVSWLRRHGVDIRYAAGQLDFSQRALDAKCPGAPIVFTGGGNLGDLWPDHQNFRERIIEKNRARPVWILPQSVFFKSPSNLERAKRVFGAHPDLTICLRDETSFRFAERHFTSAKLIYAPDMAFELSSMFRSEPSAPSVKAVLFLSRRDQELGSEPSLELRPEVIVDRSDWFNMGSRARFVLRWSRRLPRPLKRFAVLRALPPDRASRRVEEKGVWDGEGKAFNRRSLQFMRSAIRQFEPYSGIVTNRLHAHVLACLLGKPSVLLPNSYHKNAAFFASWTSGLPRAHFAEDPKAVPGFFLNEPTARKADRLVNDGQGGAAC